MKVVMRIVVDIPGETTHCPVTVERWIIGYGNADAGALKDDRDALIVADQNATTGAHEGRHLETPDAFPRKNYPLVTLNQRRAEK
jgi:hypothetical protein